MFYFFLFGRLRGLLLISALLAGVGAYAQRPNAALNMALLGRWQDPAFHPANDRYNDIWGYAAPNGREYAIIGNGRGTHFVDVTDPRAPRLVQTVTGRQGAGWRDFKTYGHYAYAVADGHPQHSLQILDLSYLPDSVHLVLDSDTLCPAAHTCFIEGDRLYLVSVRRPREANPWHDVDIYSLANPEQPRRLHNLNIGRLGGAAHAVFVRRDTLYVSGSYGGLYVFDVRQAAAPRLLLHLQHYRFDGYNHSAWTSTDGRLLAMADEVPQGLPLKLFDLHDLARPRLLSTLNSYPGATPHNPYVVGDRYIVASWYQDGVQVWDAADPANPVRIGYYDTYPENDSSARGVVLTTGGVPQDSSGGYGGFRGCWGVYPFLPSGTLIASDMQHGLFVLAPPYPVPVVPAGPPAPIGPEVAGPETAVGLWPNPTSGDVSLALRHSSALLTVDILDALGRRVRPRLTWVAPVGPVTVPLRGLAPGAYWLRVLRTDDVPRLERLIIAP